MSSEGVSDVRDFLRLTQVVDRFGVEVIVIRAIEARPNAGNLFPDFSFKKRISEGVHVLYETELAGQIGTVHFTHPIDQFNVTQFLRSMKYRLKDQI